MIADAMGAELESIRETYERALTPRRLEVACRVIEADTVGAVRFETIGVIGGRDAIVVEHVDRMAVILLPTGCRLRRTERTASTSTAPRRCAATSESAGTAPAASTEWWRPRCGS